MCGLKGSGVVVSPAAAPASASAQQLVVTAASGSFTLGFQSETTASIDLPTTAAAVQAALAALPLIGTGNVQVIGSGTWASPFYVSFTGDMAGQNLPPLTLTSTASVANTVVTSYNADSQTATIGDNFSDYAYSYDGQGNTATVNNAGTPGVPDVVLTSVYDGMGNRTSLSATIAGVKDFINNYSYDALSRLYDVIQQGQSGGNAVAPKQVYYKLDGIGDVTEIDRSTSTIVGPNPNGFADSLLTYWPTTGQLKEINHESGGASVDDLTYSYDGVGRVETFGSIDGSVTYGYDPMSQLKSATYTTASGGHQPGNESFNFDTNGNRPAANGTTTTDNEVPDDGTFHYTFDGAGNRLTRTRDSSAPANDYEVDYTWDAANRLVEVQDFNNSRTLTEQINYTYDVFDHLIGRVDDVIGGSTTTAHYIWDDLLPLPPGEGWGEGSGNQVDGGIVLALNSAGDVTNRYLNGPNTSAYDQFFSTLTEENDTATPAVVTWDLLDALGSVRDVASSTGAVLDHLNYNSFGNITYESAPTVSHIDGYAGGLYDPSTGLVYFIHRWFDPLATVWISADPMGFAAGDANLTRYVTNSPVIGTDRSGLVGPEEFTINPPQFWDGALLIGKGMKLPVYLLKWAADNDVALGQSTRGIPWYSTFWNKVYLPSETVLRRCQRVGGAGAYNPTTDITAMRSFYNELFHAWFDQSLENNRLAGAWLWNIIRGQAGLTEEEVEESMSELIERAIAAMQKGEAIPTYAEAVAQKNSDWYDAMTGGHHEGGEKFGNAAAGATVINEKLYYATFWLLYNGYANPLPHRKPGTPGSCSPLISGLDDGDVLFHLKQFFNATLPRRKPPATPIGATQ